MRVLVLVPFLFAVGCAKEKPAAQKPTNIVDKEGGITDATDVPADADSRKFADHLIRHPITNFSPTDGGGASIKWVTVTFGPKNHWIAEAKVSADGETVDCVESGAWSMDKADNEHKASVALKTDKSTCPGRSDSQTYRLSMTWEKGDYEIDFR